MPFSEKKRKIRVFALAMLFALLTACGTKTSTDPALQLLPPQDVTDNGAELTGAEITALKSTGQIDRHVPEHAMPDIAIQYKYFLRDGRNTMCSFSRRSEQYLAYARKVFRDRGMPEELANLAIIESGYRPNAVSRVGAAGAWQFMPETGKHYGLAQDWWQDERLDPYKATEAAADYLQKLHNDFGDWPTAIAAYNAGEGKISRAKAGTGGKDFFEVNALNHKLDEKTALRDETRQYVPRFMAVTKIMRNLPGLGFDPIAPEKVEGVARLAARPGTDLREFSRACKLSWDEFASYNQHHKRNITCTDRVTNVYVPQRARELADNYLANVSRPTFAGWRPVSVPRGSDSLEKISRRANIPLASLRAANPDAGRLSAGQTILAPAGIRLLPEKKTPVVAAKRSGRSERAARTHTFTKNETLYSVAKKYNTSVAALKARNGINDAGKVRAGAVLAIPGADIPHQGKSSGKIGKRRATYTVQAKDNLWKIARRHNISVDDLRRWNGINDKNLRPGASLVVSN